MADLTLEQIKRMPPELRREALKSLPDDQLLAMAPKPAQSETASGPSNLQMTLRNMSTDKLVELQKASPEQRVRILQGKSADKSFGESALDTVVQVGEFVDKYTGAPARAALSEVVKSPTIEGVGTGVQKYVEHFGEDPNLAPTGKDIARQLKVSDDVAFKIPFTDIDVSKSGLAGFGIDVIADPTNLIPVGAIAKAAGKGVVQSTKAAGKVAKLGKDIVLEGSAKAAELARATKLGEEVLTKAGKFGEAAAATTKGVLSPVKNAASSTRNALGKLFNPKVSDDFAELSLIAEKNGINPNILPEGVEFGENSIISRAARVQREGLLGEELLDNFYNGLSKVRKAVDNKAAEIGNGVVLSRVDAGAVLRDGFDKGVDKILSNANTTYNTVIKDYPGLKLSKEAMSKLDSQIGGLESFAKRRAVRGFSAGQRSQGEQLLNSVESIRSNNGSFKQMVEALKDVGDVAFKNKNMLEIDPPDVQRLQKLYGDIRDALMDTIRTDVKDGEAVAGALQINNSIISDLFSDKAVVGRVLGNSSLGPEKVFDSLIKNGDTRKIEALKNVVDADDWKMVKGAFVESLIKRDPADGSFSFKELRNAVRNKKDVIESILDPNEIDDLSDIIRLGDRFGVAVMSTSGTGASNIFKDVYSAIQQGVTNDAFIQALKNRARNISYEPRGFSVPKLSAPRSGFALPEVSERTANTLEFGKQGSRIISIQERNKRNQGSK